MKRTLIPLFVLLTVAAGTASAQDKAPAPHKFGLTFPNIGVIWHITNSIAFIPEINLSHGWAEFTPGTNRDYSSNAVGVNAALRFYIQDWKGIRFYVTPRYGYSWTGSHNTYNYTDLNGATIVQSVESHTHNHMISGAWGVQYAVHDRVSLFADIGARYSRSSLDDNTYAATSIVTIQRTNTISTAGTWGLIVYLK